MHDFARAQPKFAESVLKFLAPERLEPYKIKGDLIDETIIRYYWNIKLCESLYAPLQTLEIVLRNAVNNVCFKHFDDEMWFSQGFFTERELSAIDGAVEKLEKQRKPLDSCRIVAELTFGYWTSMFNEGYEINLFRPALSNIFHSAPKEFRKRSKISSILNDVRLLRNRVFHYEPIWNDRKITRKHNDILELIYWMNDDIFYLTKAVDEFNVVYESGFSYLAEKIYPFLRH